MQPSPPKSDTATLFRYFKRKSETDLLEQRTAANKPVGLLDHLPIAPATKYRKPNMMYRDAQSVAFVANSKGWKDRICQMCAVDGSVTRAHHKDLNSIPNRLCANHARWHKTWECRDPCTMCLQLGTHTQSHFKNTDGKLNKLCADHARACGTWTCRYPCVVCLVDGVTTQSNYEDGHGNLSKLCAEHARDQGTWKCRRPCTSCLVNGTLTESGYRDTAGVPSKLCADHAREAGTWECTNPCTMCLVDGISTGSSYKDSIGRFNQLCATHAHEAGTWECKSPCTMCIEVGIVTEANYKDTDLRPRKLCSRHARERGTWECLCPCATCLEAGVRTDSNYKDLSGNLRSLCARHAVEAGTHFASVPMASMVACKFFDRLSLLTGLTYPHVHFTREGTIGTEIQGLIPGRKYRPDSYVEETREVWLFHGNHWHGYPPGHNRHDYGVGHHDIPSSDLYTATAAQMDIYSRAGYKVKYVWEHEYNETTKARYPRPLLDVVREWTHV